MIILLASKYVFVRKFMSNWFVAVHIHIPKKETVSNNIDSVGLYSDQASIISFLNWTFQCQLTTHDEAGRVVVDLAVQPLYFLSLKHFLVLPKDL